MHPFKLKLANPRVGALDGGGQILRNGGHSHDAPPGGKQLMILYARSGMENLDASQCFHRFITGDRFVDLRLCRIALGR